MQQRVSGGDFCAPFSSSTSVDGPVDDPDVVLAVDGDAGDLAEDPFVGQRLGPERINGELGRLGVGLRGDVGAGENECGSQGRKQQAVHGRSPVVIGPRGRCRVGLLWCKPTPKFRMGRIVEYAVAWGTGMPEMHARPLSPQVWSKLTGN